MNCKQAYAAGTAKLLFRCIRQEEAEQTVEMEKICFPPHEACSPDSMRERVANVPELFLTAVDENTGLLAGFLTGLATDEERFRDAFFTDASLYRPAGSNVMLLGLNVLPAYRHRGLARELVRRYAEMAEQMGKSCLILTCLEEKVRMYRDMGFQDRGISDSVWGGEQWHEMVLKLKPPEQPAI